MNIKIAVAPYQSRIKGGTKPYQRRYKGGIKAVLVRYGSLPIVYGYFLLGLVRSLKEDNPRITHG